ncbi:unnamed protein product, partial [Heterosigma akashiwo]
INDTLRDGAQEQTIRATAVAWLSGDLCADSFLPPGKVADYFGFQYLRDSDDCEMGHNSEFAAMAAAVMLETLNATQREWLIQYAYEEAGEIDAASITDIHFGTNDEIIYGRFPMQMAFRELLDEGRESLSRDRMEAYSEEMYMLDGKFTHGRAKVFTRVLNSLNATQRAHLDELGCMTEWPDHTDLELFDKSHGNFIKTLYTTFAGQLLSWYKGSQEADAYFAPERVANYFGLFYLKDISSIMTHNVTIDADATKDLGEQMLETLTSAQQEKISGIVDAQRADYGDYYVARLDLTAELRAALNGHRAPDEAKVMALSAEVGRLDARVAHLYAITFAELYHNMTAKQLEDMVKLRNLEEYPCSGTFYYSWNQQEPEV